ncbi:MAG TPA: amino acid racemase [Chloroflexia bacterium]|nr:amino acid racemase [Chloroflexia bacterium]
MPTDLEITHPSSGFKTIGVIGGLGPQATMDFEERIHKVSQELISPAKNGGYPPMIVYYVREAPLILVNGKPKDGVLEPAPALLEAARKVGAYSDFIVIASNTPHFFLRELENASGRKILSMIDVTIAEVQRLKLKRVGVLGVGITLENGLYQRRLEQIGVSWETIPDTLAAELDKSIWSLMEGMEGKEEEHSQEIAKQTIAYLRAKDVERIILGCTEIPLLLKDVATDFDLINPAQLLAEATVRYAIQV